MILALKAWSGIDRARSDLCCAPGNGCLDVEGGGCVKTPVYGAIPHGWEAWQVGFHRGLKPNLSRIPSSRRLEREAGRNVEAMWLTGRLVPDHKTIADFRRENGPTIRRTCAEFVELCRRMGVLRGDCVAVDGSKFKTVNNRDRNFTKAKIASRLAHLEKEVGRYLEEAERADRQETGEARTEKIAHLTSRYHRARLEMDRMVRLRRELATAPDGQMSLTDPGMPVPWRHGRSTAAMSAITCKALSMPRPI